MKLYTWVMLLLFSFITTASAQNHLGSIRIYVKDFYTESPLPGTGVALSPNNYFGITDESGQVLIERVMPFRNYQIKVTAEGYSDQEAGFVVVKAQEETEIVVPVKQKATISGLVERHDGFIPFLSRPLKDATVIIGKLTGDSDIFQAAHTDRRGIYTFNGVKEGTYTIMAFKDGYKKSRMLDITIPAGKKVSQDFRLDRRISIHSFSPEIIITKGLTDEPRERPFSSSTKFYFTAYPKNEFQEFYWIKEKQPPGATPIGKDLYFGEPKGSIFCFVLPSLGEYTVTLFTIDGEGNAESASISFEAINAVPEAVSSVIPGPSELPFLDGNCIYTTSSGSLYVEAGFTVYLRGFGIDSNLLSPEEFNPNAPSFDIYGNKNGNFKASLFQYTWILQDSYGFDISHTLFPSSGSETVSFKIPQGAQPGDIFQAVLTVSDDYEALSEPVNCIITVAEAVDEASCVLCHHKEVSAYADTAHAQSEVGARCQDCHGKASEHISPEGYPHFSVSYRPGVCGQCHQQFAEFQMANHSDPLPFGYYEPTDGRLAFCYRCHYPAGYIGAVESGTPFHDFRYESEVLPDIPKDGVHITCSACHDPHGADNGALYNLRTGGAANTCDTCHYEKWQDAVLEGTAGNTGYGFHYPNQDYSLYAGENNPHRTEKKCATCHLSTPDTIDDSKEVRKIGGHTFRMRDFGKDQIPGTADDLLNIPICQKCHQGLDDFDRNGLQTRIRNLLDELGILLREHNHGFLPADKPGKCVRCHHGQWTVPFLDDPDEILERAYTNYKLIINDRSFGLHNPGYTKKLLQDSLHSIQSAKTSKFSKAKSIMRKN